MFAKLSALVSGSPALPYDLSDEQGEQISGCWTHHSGTHRVDKTDVSIFKFTCTPSADMKRVEAAKHGIKSLRTLRHPNVLIFKDTHEIGVKGVTSLYLVTEPVQLLSTVLDNEAMSTTHRHHPSLHRRLSPIADVSARNAYISMGLRQVACALSFLNNDCHQVHGNVCWSSILVSQNLDWKLSCMDMLSECASLSTSMLRDCGGYVADVYKCPEFAKQDWDSLVNGPPWAIDSWGMGCLIREVFGNGPLNSPASLRETDCIPADLLKDYQRLLSSQAAKRLNPHRLMKNKHLHNHLVDAVSFLENLAVKETAEKNTFFKKLIQTMDDLPEMVIHQKILPMVTDALEFGSASPNAIGCIMRIAEDMNEEQFKELIAPALTRFFNSTDRTIRRVLLENIEKFGNRLPASLIEEAIYPSLTNGFSDNNAYLRELTLKSMQYLAPRLSPKTLNQSLLKFLARLQVDQEPSIRANTTVLLGFIADHLGDVSCKRILLNAFSRALKDQFPPARLAGLKALCATKKYYSQAEVAQKLIPSLSPLCIDGSEEVKKQALTCMDVFLVVLKEVAETEVDTNEGVAAAAETNASTAKTYVSWAVSSLGFAQSTETENKPAPTVKPVERQPSPVVSPPRSSGGRSVNEIFHHSESVSSGSEEEEGAWDFDDEPFEEDPKTKTAPDLKTTSRSESASHRASSDRTDERDMWSDLGMKAEQPRRAAERRKPKGSTKPMKLGAKKLNVD